MGLNKIFRRFTEHRLGNNYLNKTDKLLSKQNECTFIVGSNEDTNSDILNLCNNKPSCYCPPAKKSAASTYPSCPTLNVSSIKNGTQNNGAIASCCVSSSSSSLIIHQQQTLSKSSTSFLRLKRSATAVRQNSNLNNQKKRSWILPRGHSFAPALSDSFAKLALTQLPENLLLKCIDKINDPFELCRLKMLNSSIYHHIQQRLDRVIEMDVRKIKFDTISSELALLAQSSHTTSTTFLVGDKIWYAHKLGYKVVMRFTDGGRRIEIIVDDCWTSKDVILLHNIMEVFRLTLQRISLDAPIFELVSNFFVFIDAILLKVGILFLIFFNF